MRPISFDQTTIRRLGSTAASATDSNSTPRPEKSSRYPPPAKA
jgi:hypothetical protein